MRGNKLKVHAFRVIPVNRSIPFEDLLSEIQHDSLSDRVRSTGANRTRIETVEKIKGLWYIDFGKFRASHGPGAAAEDSPVRGFEFSDNEVFCEETAMLYDPVKSFAIIQYNHFGARVGVIQEYFNVYSDADVNTYEFRPKYDEDAERRFDNRAATKSLRFKIDPRVISNNERAKNTGLAKALDIGDASNGTSVEVVVTVGREKNRYLSRWVDKTINVLRRKMDEEPDAVIDLEVGILPHLDSTIEKVDLIAHRLSHTYNDLPLGDDLRIPVEDRFNALRRSYRSWKGLF